MSETFSEELSKRLAVMVGVLLLAEGIWGFFSPVVFGVLTTNKLHATIHVIFGLAGVMMGLRGNARAWCIGVGVVLLVVGVMRLVPPAADLVVTWLNVNEPVAYVNIVVGTLMLIAALSHLAGGNSRDTRLRR